MAATSDTASQRPRKERSENAAMRRRQIIEATLNSIEKNGLAGTTLATVSREAGLSQGVAVFYFQNKQALLDAALRSLYSEYQECWQRARREAGENPVERIVALAKAELDPTICTPRTLAVWHAFWGESSARPLYAEIATDFDAAQGAATREAISDLIGADDRKAEILQTSIGAITDGLWMHMHLSLGTFTREMAVKTLGDILKLLFPDHRSDFDAAFPD